MPQFARLGHLQDVFVKDGKNVKKGDKIGTVGTGNGQWSAHLHADFPKKKLGTWTEYVFGMTKAQVKKLYADPKEYRTKWYDHMGWGYLDFADYSGKKCYHPGEDWNGKGAGNADIGLVVTAPFDGEIVYCYTGKGSNLGWGKLVVIKETEEIAPVEDKTVQSISDTIEEPKAPQISISESTEIPVTVVQPKEDNTSNLTGSLSDSELKLTLSGVDATGTVAPAPTPQPTFWGKIIQLITKFIK